MSPPEAFPKSKVFDKLSFAKYMKNIGRAYRKQAMELISTCRTFVQAGEGSASQDADLKRVLEFTDDALSSAADARNKTSEAADTKFKIAINELSDYEQKYHQKQQDATNGQQDVTNGETTATETPLLVAERMKRAQENDKSSSKILNRLKHSFKAKLVEKPMKVARFLFPGSLPDKNPKVVEQMLGEETGVEEILWNFSRLKDDQRITLKQNPRFYRGLPDLAPAYSHDFTTDPLDNFRGETEIWVLTDKQSRVFLEAGEKKRVFGNFWVPHEAIIFKDICGRLEGERIVAEDIQGTPNLWHRVDSIGIPSSHVRIPTTGPVNPTVLPPIITNPVGGRTFEDWKELVRDTLSSPNISICISTNGTPSESSDKWVLSSPINPTPASPARPFSTTQAGSPVASSGATAPHQLPPLRIPEPSPGPQTAQSYKSARSTYSPVFRTPMTELPSPLPSTPSPRKPSAVAAPSPAKLTPISRDSPVAFLSSLSLTMTTLTSPQARPLPPRGPDPPPQKAASAGAALISSGVLTSSSRASSPEGITLSPSTNDLARPLGLQSGDSPAGNRISVTVSVPATPKAPATNLGQQQIKCAAAPAKGPAQAEGKKKNWFQKFIWDYDKGK
ncbi:hypothetical protein H4582DRAFT_118549 [Lactarius indigo]|nr:hypothetical protein H4582DRAFT_118549 [Lactarius indigo]